MGARGSPYEMYETVSTTTRGRILLRMAAASAPATAPASKRDRTHYLYLSVIAAVVLGIIVGLVAPALGKAVQPLGTAFIALIKRMISPIIFCTIVLGIGKIRKAAQSEISSGVLWWPEGKIAGRHLSPYLARRAHAVEPKPPLTADAIPVDVDLVSGSGREIHD